MKRSAPEGGRSRGSYKSGGSARSNDDENFIGARNDIILEDNLLQRADDSQIRKSLLDLNEVIDQHCENHYYLGSLGVNQHDLEPSLVECGYNSFDVYNSSVAESASLLQNPHSRLIAIRQLVAMVLFAHIDWRSTLDTSLLPPQISAFCQTIATIEKQTGSKEIFEKAFFKWRHLSAFLMEPFCSNRGIPKLSKEVRACSMKRRIRLPLRLRLRSWDFLFFSQPPEWLLEWFVDVTEMSGGTGGSRTRKSVGRDLVGFPGIWEVIDRGGEK